MNIQEAVKKSLETKKMITRESYGNGIYLIPTNNIYHLVALFSEHGNKNRLPGRGWQPFAEDLIANDWYLTDKSYEHSILDNSKRIIEKMVISEKNKNNHQKIKV